MAHPYPFLQAPRNPSLTDEQLTLLVVDDDILHARLLKANLERPGRLRVEVTGSGPDALERIAAGPIDAVLTDLAMPEMDGIELVRRIRAADPALPVVIMTAHASIPRAVEGIRAGATDFLPKPVNPEALIAFVERAVQERPLREALVRERQRVQQASISDYLIGRHPLLDEVRNAAARIATSGTSRVLLTGETGTGKSLLAHAIHELSGDTGRLVEVNCAAIPANLLESELFGNERGAFPDATETKRGLFELCDRGTIILDEIGALPLELQAKLLQVLERGEIRRVGGLHPMQVRVRVIACTNDDLNARVRERTFRQDLLYRLDVAHLHMPTIREMPEIVPDLVRHFVHQVSVSLNRPTPEVDPRCIARLEEYRWPGNGRELRNAIERALIFHTTGPLEVCEPPVEWDTPAPDDMDHYAPMFGRERIPAERAQDGEAASTGKIVLEMGLPLSEVERRYIEATIEGRPADYGTLADQLGISRKTLWKKRLEYGL